MYLVIWKGYTFRDKNQVKWVLRHRDGGSSIIVINDWTAMNSGKLVEKSNKYYINNIKW